MNLNRAEAQGESVSKGLMLGLAFAVLAVVAAVYFPVVHAGFVWDDWPSFRDLQGDNWAHYVFRDFNQWTLYFRPLVVAFLALQVKLFHSTPGPMHAVSLALHLANAALVGALAHRASVLTNVSPTRRHWMVPACMLLYGLHPALIETVSWIGCQFDLITTLFILLGLIANASLQQPLARAGAIALCFFLAICSKEAGATFPFLVVLFDAALFAREGKRSIADIVRTLWRRNRVVYASLVVAGISDFLLRRWAVGAPGSLSTLSATRAFSRTWWMQLQEVCMTYLCYLKVIIWPMAGLGPLHPEDISAFQSVTVATVFACVTAIGVVAAGFYLALKRGLALGFIILAVTISLLPVLRLIPVDFDHNLYHERYATLAIAMSCALLPLLQWPRVLTTQGTTARSVRQLLPVAIGLWLILCTVDIRVVSPNWSSDIALWRWAIALDPHSAVGQSNLLVSYDERGDSANVQKLADAFLVDPVKCTACLLQVARISVDRNDPARAAAALQRVSDTPLVTKSLDGRQFYYRELGRLTDLQGRHAEARKLLEAALALKPADAATQSALAKAIASESAAGQGH